MHRGKTLIIPLVVPVLFILALILTFSWAQTALAEAPGEIEKPANEQSTGRFAADNPVSLQEEDSAISNKLVTDGYTAAAAAVLYTDDPGTVNKAAREALLLEEGPDLAVNATAAGEVQVVGQEGDVFDITNPGPFPFAPGYTTDPDLVSAGRRISYTLTISNTSPLTATNVTLVDDLPEGVTIVPGSLDVSQGSCNTGSQQVSCGLGTMENGSDASLSFHVYVDPSLDPTTVLINDAIVQSDDYDGDNSNNFASTAMTVNTWADMEITKLSVGENLTGYDSQRREFIIEDLAGQVTSGRMLRYEITVQNSGPSDGRGVQILDLLPGQSDSGLDNDPVTFLSASEATCEPMSEQQELGIFE